MTHDRTPRGPLTATTVGTVLAVLLGLLLLASPARAADEDPAGLPPGGSWVRVGHFVPGMGATTIKLARLTGAAGTTVLADGATYGQVSEYQKLAPGSYSATVVESSMPAGSAPLLSRSFEVTAGEARTLAVVGTSDAPRLALLTDDLTPPDAGAARVRVLSASEEADGVTVEAVDGPTIAEGAVLGQATPYATVPAGSWTLELQGSAAGVRLQDVAIASGSVYTIVVLDGTADAVELQVVTDAAGAAVAPRGGAQTGGGGTAATTTGGSSVVLVPLAGLALLLVAGAVAQRRRPTTWALGGRS